MFNTARTQLRRHCICITRTRSATAISNTRNFTLSSRNSNQDLPWFVDPSTVPSSDSSPTSTSRSTLATAPVPTAPPSHLSTPLHPLHAHLSVSPFFDKDTLTYIHAREADPLESWCDWVVICTLKEGRERSLRGAVEGVRTYLAANPVEFLEDSTTTTTDTPSPSNPSPFSPPSSHPILHGLPPTTASKHARSRARKGPPPTRQDQASGWALLDAGTLVVHVMTKEARKEYGDEIERVWKGVAKEEGISTKKEQLESLERERELQENMRQVEEEMKAEEEEEEERRIQKGNVNVV